MQTFVNNYFHKKILQHGTVVETSFLSSHSFFNTNYDTIYFEHKPFSRRVHLSEGLGGMAFASGGAH